MQLDQLLKGKKEYKNKKTTLDSRYFYQIELDKTCFQHDMIYEDFKDLSRKAGLVKYYVKMHFILPKNLKYHVYQRGLTTMGCNYF